MANHDLTAIASMLESTMTNAGYMDDYDELLGNIIDRNKLAAVDFHHNVMDSLAFINDQLDKDYDVTVDGSGSMGQYSFHMIYQDMMDDG